MVQTQIILGQGHFGPWNLHLIKLGEGQVGNVTSQPSGSEEEYFVYFPMHFYGSNPEPLGQGLFLP